MLHTIDKTAGSHTRLQRRELPSPYPKKHMAGRRGFPCAWAKQCPRPRFSAGPHIHKTPQLQRKVGPGLPSGVGSMGRSAERSALPRSATRRWGRVMGRRGRVEAEPLGAVMDRIGRMMVSFRCSFEWRKGGNHPQIGERKGSFLR